MANRALSSLSARLVARTSLWRPACARQYSKDTSHEDLGTVQRKMQPSSLEKRILVWTKVYNNLSDIPEHITVNQMNYSKDRFRAKMMLPLMAATLFGFWLMMISGRNLLKSGDSLTLRGTEQVARWQEEERLRRESEAQKHQ